MTVAIVESSSGAASASATKPAITSGVAGRISIPPTNSPISCRRYLSRVTTPKFPPPPRSAQNRSGWLSASTCRSSPSAVTTSAASRSSTVSPCLRTRKPTPPLSVMPATPTEPVSPKPVARPCSPAAAVYAPVVSPAPAHAVRARRVDLELVERGEVEHDPAVGDAVAGHAVAAAADGELGAGLTRQRDDACDVRRVGGAHDHRRPAVDRRGRRRPGPRRSRDRRGRRSTP